MSTRLTWCFFFALFCFLSLDVHVDVRKTELPDGRVMFCVWMKRPGQQGTLLQADWSLNNQSEVSLGEVGGS